MSKPIIRYAGQEIEVTWDGRLCIHVGECVRAEGELFVSGRDPWCQPDLVGREQVRSVVERCPTGALSYTDKTGGPEPAPPENRVLVANDGPLYFSGELAIEGAPEDMPGVKRRAALCRCGASKNKPFCDNSHREAGFKDAGAVGSEGTGLQERGGPLKVRLIPNGPLKIEGNLSIYTGAGRLAWEGTQTALCRCGASKNKPFCDGTHREIGFKTD